MAGLNVAQLKITPHNYFLEPKQVGAFMVDAAGYGKGDYRYRFWTGKDHNPSYPSEANQGTNLDTSGKTEFTT